MADSPSNQPVRSNSDPDPQYWCYHCDKRIFIETLANLPDIIYFKCKNEISSGISELVDDLSFSNQFLQVLQLIAQVVSDKDVMSLSPPLSHQNQPKDDFLRIELKGLDNDKDNDDEDNKNGDEFHNAGEEENEAEEVGDRSDEDNRGVPKIDEEELGQRHHDLLHLRIRAFMTFPELDRYVGNLEDYVDTTGYEALLQNLAESDGSGRRGAPPASKTTS
ncbi:hypothetical protein UlMin_020518 [Ulmus minor]